MTTPYTTPSRDVAETAPAGVDQAVPATEEISLFAIGTTLLRYRRMIVGLMLLGAVIAGLTVITKRPLYVASGSFTPQLGPDPGRSGLAGLAGQFGISVPGSMGTPTPEFYTMLLTSRSVLMDIVDDTLVVREMGGRRMSIYEIFEIGPGPTAARQEQAMNALRGVIGVSLAKSMGVVNFSVKTEWPSVSLALAQRLVEGVEEYNRRTRQGQAADERRFVEGRLALAAGNLRAAEERLQAFLRSNRDVGGSPDLAFQRDRLQREVAFQQQLYTSLAQAHEEVRIREVRDTPVITVIEPPAVSTNPEGRGLRRRATFGLVAGGFIAAVLALVLSILNRRRRLGDPDADEFLRTLSQLKHDLLMPVHRLRGRTAA